MSFKTEWVRFGRDRHGSGFCAWGDRAAAPVPSVIVIQEAWGVDRHIEDVAVRFARAGYVAVAPDLFSQGGERPAPLSRPRMDAVKEFINTLAPGAWGDPKLLDEAFARLPAARRPEVRESFDAMRSRVTGDVDGFVSNLVECAEYLRGDHPLSRGARVGSVGYCLGGLLSARLACADPKLGAAVIYYGHAPPAERLGAIACPVLGFYGGLDERVNSGIPALAESMKKLGKRFEHHVYPGAQHAFFNDTRPTYDVRASRDAFARTLEFFRKELS